MTYRPGDPLIGFRITRQPARMVLGAVVAFCRILDRLVFGMRIQGREILDRIPRAILVSNHTLLLDPAVIAAAIHPRRTYFTVLEETARVKGLGTFVRLLGAIPLPPRPSARDRLRSELASAVAETGYVHFFPEGECYQWSQMVHPLHRGAFQVAVDLGLPVVPVTTALHDRPRLKRLASVLLGREARVPPRVTVVVGPAIAPPLPAATGASTARARAALMADITRRVMQEAIDRAGGCRTIDRGWLPRLVGPNRRNGTPLPVDGRARVSVEAAGRGR